MGWQDAAYTLMSGRWFSAEECEAMGLVWRVTDPGSLLAETLEVADELAANPIPSLVATKALMLESGRPDGAWAAHQREVEVYTQLMGAAANAEVVAAFLDQREPDFGRIPGL